MERGGFVPPPAHPHEWLFLSFVFNWNPRTQALLLYLFFLFFGRGRITMSLLSSFGSSSFIPTWNQCCFPFPSFPKSHIRAVMSAAERTNKQKEQTKKAKKSFFSLLNLVALCRFLRQGRNQRLAGGVVTRCVLASQLPIHWLVG